jgi:hypothetical protein
MAKVTREKCMGGTTTFDYDGQQVKWSEEEVRNRWTSAEYVRNGDRDLVHVHYEDTGVRTGTNLPHGRKRQAGSRTVSDTRNFVLDAGKDVAGVDRSLADEQGGIGDSRRNCGGAES